MSDMQQLVNLMNAIGQEERSKYHITLSKIISLLEDCNPSLPIRFSDDGKYPGEVDSYRGYYSDLAFDPSDDPRTVGEVLVDCRNALGSTFEGYKGGNFVMNEATPLWVSGYGTCDGRAVMGVEVKDDEVILTIVEVE